MEIRNRVVARIKRELAMRPVIAAGHTRKTASIWYKKTQRDIQYHSAGFSKKQIKAYHRQGFLCETIKKYGITDTKNCGLISDLDYLYLRPFNNSFAKWIEDIITTQRVLSKYENNLRKIYFSIIQRDGAQIILPYGGSNKKNTTEDIIQLLKKEERLELRPSHWESKRKRYQLAFRNGRFYINAIPSSADQIRRIISALPANYIVSEPVSLEYSFDGKNNLEHSLKLWLSNDANESPTLLSAVMNIYWNDERRINKSVVRERHHQAVAFNIEDGTFTFGSQQFRVSGWEQIKENILSISGTLKQLDFYTMTIALRTEGNFQLLHFSASPKLPEIPYNKELFDYLTWKVAWKRANVKVTLKTRLEAIKDSWFKRFVEKFCRKGIRPYMQKVWMNAVKDDFLHTRGATIRQKFWTWKHGFFSYRLWQYGLTKDNYKNFLSDYDYYWLNRINNDYQKWVNDKTTYRIILDPLKQYIPQYYFSVFKRGKETVLSRMADCPPDISCDLNGILTLLQQKGRLAFKPSAGTHGDGFYCFEYQENGYFVNGKACTEQELLQIISSQKSYYIVTAYLVMHEFFRKIYPTSVNTIRIMVVNQHGYDPKIMQTYIRIGSSRTGFTDNVGYGGICAMIDKDSGEIYMPQTIREHIFYDCPVHPDTGTPISGMIPNWQEIRSAVLEVATYLGELEYLGFDMALTETGPCILEINIHQDLHKVAMFTDEMNEFFRKKITRKKMMA